MGTLSIKSPCTIDMITPGRSNSLATIGWGGTDDFTNFFTTDSGIIQRFAAANYGLGAGILFIILNDANLTGVIQFGWDHTTAVFILDGAAPVSFDNLPAGFNITSLLMTFDLLASLSFEAITVTVGGTPVPLVSGSYPIQLAPTGSLDPLTFLGQNIVITVVQEPGNGLAVAADFANFSATGTYTTVAFQFTVANETSPGNPFKPGHIINITSNPGDPSALILNQLLRSNHPTGIFITYTDPILGAMEFEVQQGWILTYEPYQLRLLVPAEFGPNGPPNFTVNVVGNGTQFSGSIPLGILSILRTNGSGLYKITTNKRSDTMYRHDGSGTVEEVQFPNPMIKSAFVGG